MFSRRFQRFVLRISQQKVRFKQLGKTSTLLSFSDYVVFGDGLLVYIILHGKKI